MWPMYLPYDVIDYVMHGIPAPGLGFQSRPQPIPDFGRDFSTLVSKLDNKFSQSMAFTQCHLITNFTLALRYLQIHDIAHTDT